MARASNPMKAFKTKKFTIESFPITPYPFLQYTGYFSKLSVQSNEHGFCAFILLFKTESETRNKHTQAKSKRRFRTNIKFSTL